MLEVRFGFKGFVIAMGNEIMGSVESQNSSDNEKVVTSKLFSEARRRCQHRRGGSRSNTLE